METNQNFNMNSYSLSSSSSGNLQNDSKKSHSKKSILRKEGSQSKNKDRHATFVEPSMNQVAFYLPDINNLNKNNRISLNTVSEEPEPNSRSGSDLINNRILSSNRVAVKTEQKLTFDNNEFNANSFISDANNINNRTFTNFNNDYISFYNNNNGNNTLKDLNKDKVNNIQVIESKAIIFKNQNNKKPASRKTLESDYLLKDFSQNNNDININSISKSVQNIPNESTNKINLDPPSKVLKIRLSNSGRNSFSSESNLNMSLEQNKNNVSINNNNISSMNKNQVKNVNTSINSDNSSNERRAKRDEQTKINTEINKNLFRVNAPRESLTGSYNDIPKTNNLIDNMSYQINDIIAKNDKKPNFKKRITMAITNDDDFYIENNKNNDEIKNLNNNINNNDLSSNDMLNNINNNNNLNNIIIPNKEKKMPKMNKKRITLAMNPFEDEQNLFNDNNLEQKLTETIPIVNNVNNSKRSYKEYSNSYNANEEITYVEPKITAENKNIDYEVYEKYLKYNNFSFPKSESKINNITNLNFPKKEENENVTGSQTSRKDQQIINSDNLMNNLEKLNQNNININDFNSNLNKLQNKSMNILSSPLIELINDKSFSSKGSDNTLSKQDEKYNIILNDDENFDIEKEINNQITFIEKNLEEKEKNWKTKIINNAERHAEFESEINQNKNELNNIDNKINEIIIQKNEIIKNKNKYEALSEKAQEISDKFSLAGIEIKDIEHIMFKEMNCLLFTVMIKNLLVFKFLISDNIWYEKNLSGESEVTFIGVLKTEVFSYCFEEETIINKDKNANDLIQNYYYETICKIFPNEYEKINIHELSRKYYLATQISICFIHILKMINQISLVGEDVIFKTEDLKKYYVKFSYIDIFSAKINFIFELNIENPFSGNCLNSVEVERNEYILNNFDDYKKETLNLINKYFNPKDIRINYNYFYNAVLMLGYIDKARAFKTEINDEYISNVMKGNIKPKEDEFENEEINKFNDLELSQQLEIIYGKKFLEQLRNNNINDENENEINDENENEINDENNKKDKDIEIKDEIGNNGSNSKADDEEIKLDLPSSHDDNDEK